jgi:hypothetical protein
MTRLDVEEIRALDFGRGSSAEIAMWREDDEESRVNLAIEGMALEPDDEDALFDMLREEAVPLPSPPRSSSSCSAWRAIPISTRC